MHAFFLLISLSFSAHAAKLTTVKYNTDSCRCTARVDPSQIDPRVISSAMGLPSEAMIQDRGALWTQYWKMSPRRLKQEADEFDKVSLAALRRVNAAGLPKSGKWSAYRASLVRDIELTRYLRLAQFGYLITKQVDVLKQPFKGEKPPATCIDMAEALKTDATVLKRHEEMTLVSCRTNADPLECADRAKQTRESIPETRVEVLSLGWNNCVNKAWRKNTDDTYRTAVDELKKSLKNENCDCDEP
jgi:hypothetical protein